MKQIGCDYMVFHNPRVEGSRPTGPKDRTPCDERGGFVVLWNMI